MVAGQDVFALSEDRLRAFRNRTLGFIFQFHHLLPEFTALENVMMPMLIARRPLAEARERRKRCSTTWPRPSGRAPPGAMSGGEQQRGPSPGPWSNPPGSPGRRAQRNLDQETGRDLHALLRRLNRKRDHGCRRHPQ
jgi:lipoprotein-releasing system ATP-binding protein